MLHCWLSSAELGGRGQCVVLATQNLMTVQALTYTITRMNAIKINHIRLSDACTARWYQHRSMVPVNCIVHLCHGNGAILEFESSVWLPLPWQKKEKTITKSPLDLFTFSCIKNIFFFQSGGTDRMIMSVENPVYQTACDRRDNIMKVGTN
jgi:hypothetical protein